MAGRCITIHSGSRQIFIMVLEINQRWLVLFGERHWLVFATFIINGHNGLNIIDCLEALGYVHSEVRGCSH